MIDQEHLHFRARDGRTLQLFIPPIIWEGGDDFEMYYGGSLETWLASELAQLGEHEGAFDFAAIVRDLREGLDEQRVQWLEIQSMVGLAATHGVGEPAKLLRSRAPKEQDWLVPGLFFRGGVTLIGGREKISGKSTIVFSLVGALERNEATMFGDAYGRPLRTLIISEEPEYAIVDKLNRFDLNDAWIVQDSYWPLERFGDGSARERWARKLEQVEKLAHAIEAELVVIDPLSRIAEVDDEAGRELGSRAEAVGNMAARSGLAVVIVHHNNKRTDAAVEDRMRGSTSLTAAVEQIVQVDRRSKKHPRQRTADSYGRVEASNWTKTYELGLDTITYTEIDVIAANEEESKQDLELLRTMREATKKQFAEILMLDPTDANLQQVGRRLEKLVENGLAVKERRGRDAVYTPADDTSYADHLLHT